MQPLLEESGDHVLLLSGDGGAGKTRLALAIARWWLEGKPGGVVRLPVLIKTALVPGETVVERVRAWLRAQLAGMAGASASDPPPELVEALLAAKRLVPIIDHLSELAPAARERLLAALPPGLVVVTSRSDDDGFRERPLSRIEPQRIAVERLQAFSLDYLRRRGQGEALSDDDLMPAQAQLKRIVGDKPITVLLAQMFIDDVIAHREEGLLAGSLPELMLSYARRLDTPDKPEQRWRAGLVMDGELVQRALRVVALASHRQGPSGQPLFPPLEFSEALACAALMAEKPAGLGLGREQSEALLGYRIEPPLLLQLGGVAGCLRFPLDPLADHLAAAVQFERLEEQALMEGAAAWEAFVASLEPRPPGGAGLQRPGDQPPAGHPLRHRAPHPQSPLPADRVAGSRPSRGLMSLPWPDQPPGAQPPLSPLGRPAAAAIGIAAVVVMSLTWRLVIVATATSQADLSAKAGTLCQFTASAMRHEMP